MKPFAIALAMVTLLRLVMAATVPLAPDEAYYWIWSQALAPGYLDHPPMVALWIRAGTMLVGQIPLGVRLLGPLAAALASWLLFDAARALFPGTKAGLVAVLLLNASLLVGVGTVIMTPDSPLLLFWIAAFWAMARVATGGSGRWWLIAGVAGGCALDSKYTALFLWCGIALWVLLVPRMRFWLRRWQPWAAGAIGLILFTPVLLWNAAHDWAGLLKQGSRVNDWRPARAAGFLAELVGGQIGLATPMVWLLCMAGLGVAVQRAWRSRDPAWSLLVALSLPAVLLFLQHALGDRVQGNWPAIIYPALTVAAGGLTLRRRWWIGASGLGFAITALVYLQASLDLLPLPPRFDPIAMRLNGWDQLAQQIEAARLATGARFVTADGYALSSELAWWLPPRVLVVGVEPRWRLFNLAPVAIDGTTGLLVRDARRAEAPNQMPWTQIERIGWVDRPGTAGFTLYRLTARPDPHAVALRRVLPP